MSHKSFTRARIAGPAALGAIALTAVAVLPANAATLDLDYGAPGIATGAILGSGTNTTLPGWSGLNSTPLTVEVVGDGRLRVSNDRGTGVGFSHGSLYTPAFPVSVGEVSTGAEDNALAVEFTLVSATGGYQEGLSVSLSFDASPGNNSRNGGIVFFQHLDDGLNIGSFWFDPAENPDGYDASTRTWSDDACVGLDPDAEYLVQIEALYVDGPGVTGLNDELTITATNLGTDTVDCLLEVYTMEAQSRAASGLTTVSAITAMSFHSGINSPVSRGLTVFQDSLNTVPDGGFLFGELEAASDAVDERGPVTVTG